MDLAATGMSQRAIAAALGVSKNTVTEDRRQVSQSGTPGETKGRDGKTYKRKAKPLTCDVTIWLRGRRAFYPPVLVAPYGFRSTRTQP